MICPFALASCLIRAAPLYANLDRDARELRAIAGSDQCIIDQEEFYIRGCLEIPIIGTSEVFLWGLWARVKETAFDEIGVG
jgi:hypothetical protein